MLNYVFYKSFRFARKPVRGPTECEKGTSIFPNNILQLKIGRNVRLHHIANHSTLLKRISKPNELRLRKPRTEKTQSKTVNN